jgi:N-acetyl sugar amidotransferase
MDTTDPDIQFDKQGVCNHCRAYQENATKNVFDDEEGKQKLEKIVRDIKAKGKNKEYDCIIGVSGGMDSTYVAYKVKELGLRPLAVHLDNGWDSELAVSNIEEFLRKLRIDLYTVVLDWEEFKDLQMAFLLASVPDIEIPTDHAIVATLFHIAAQRDIRYIISGDNFTTESLLPVSWAYGHLNWQYIKSIHYEFGKGKLKNFPHLSYRDGVYYRAIKRIRFLKILDYVNYIKKEASKVLEREFAWRPYGNKHCESIYTRFIQGYILPEKFNIDKRKAHLSTLIMAGQMSREEALNEIREPAYSRDNMEEDMEYVIKKFNLTKEKFTQIMFIPAKSYKDYPTSAPLQELIIKLQLGKVARKFRLIPPK